MRFEMQYPLQPFEYLDKLVVTQIFGNTSNNEYYKQNGINIEGHNGVDYWVTHGQPVYACHDGYATYEVDNGGGHGVVIRTDKTYDYAGQQVFFKTIYWHLCDPKKEPQYTSPIYNNPNVYVHKGDLIGYCDNTGLSTGDHLHFGLKPYTANGNVEQNNGYLGSINPTVYWNGIYPGKFIFTKQMSKGSMGSEVLQLQKRLGVKQTGLFWTLTKQAVMDFQHANNLPMVGRVGPLTIAVLNR